MISVETIPRIFAEEPDLEEAPGLKKETTLFVFVSVAEIENAVEVLKEYVREFGVINFCDTYSNWKKEKRKTCGSKMRKQPDVPLKDMKNELCVVEFSNFMVANSAYTDLKKRGFDVKWHEPLSDDIEHREVHVINGNGNNDGDGATSQFRGTQDSERAPLYNQTGENSHVNYEEDRLKVSFQKIAKLFFCKEACANSEFPFHSVKGTTPPPLYGVPIIKVI